MAADYDRRTPRVARRAAAPAPGLREDVLENRVFDLCAALHLETMVITPALVHGKYRTPYHKKSTGKGWVDFTIVGPGGALFRELKKDGKYPEAPQRRWLAALKAADLDADVWRLRDWESGRIQRELAAIAKAPAVTRG